MVDAKGNCTPEWYRYFLGNRAETTDGLDDVRNIANSRQESAEVVQLRQRVDELEARLVALTMPVPPHDDLPDYLLGSAWR